MARTQLIAGLLLVIGAAGAVTELPENATVTQWVMIIAVAVVGCTSMYMGAQKE
jgi:hypothetical protein